MIKRILVLLIISTGLSGQVCESISVTPISNPKNSLSVLAGSCASPDGPDKIIASPPPSYNWLNSNGYCYTLSPATRTFNACYTFTSTSTTATFNAGYSSTGCAAISFSNFNLYTCNPSCTFVGSGLTFSGLVIGQCYTWCFSGNCVGGPGPGFTSICPYYMQNAPLPVEISYFSINQEYKSNLVEWRTSSEHNSSYFEVQRSYNAEDFISIGLVQAYGNSDVTRNYKFKDDKPLIGLNYYRLKQIDIGGTYKIYPVVVVVDNKKDSLKPYKIFNILGEQVDETYEGIKIIQYMNGKTIKTY